jgi:hypothetical protein
MKDDHKESYKMLPRYVQLLKEFNPDFVILYKAYLCKFLEKPIMSWGKN